MTTSSPSTHLWRSLLRVTSVHPEGVRVRIPAWPSHYCPLIPLDLFPADKRHLAVAGSRWYAKVNIGAKFARDLQFAEFEYGEPKTFPTQAEAAALRILTDAGQPMTRQEFFQAVAIQEDSPLSIHDRTILTRMVKRGMLLLAPDGHYTITETGEGCLSFAQQYPALLK